MTRVRTSRLLLTRGVNNRVAEDTAFAKFVTTSLKRHISGDWGDLDPEDRRANDLALETGERLLSAYQREGLPKIWIVTESNRSATTVLFPDEY